MVGSASANPIIGSHIIKRHVIPPQQLVSFEKDLVNVEKQMQKICKFSVMDISLHSKSLPNEQLDISYFTNINSKREYSVKNLYQMGSLNKTIVAYEILNLVNSRRDITLNDPITKFLPQYPAWSNITIMQLLNQTSGIYDYIESWLWWDKLYILGHKNWKAEELLDIAYKHKLPPQTAWGYSNSNYVILGMIIEKITHKPLKDTIQQIFNEHSAEPLLHLNHIYYVDKEEIYNQLKVNLVDGYSTFGTNMSHINPSWLLGGGALISRPHDMAIWYSHYANFILRDKTYLSKFVNIDNGNIINLENLPYNGNYYGFGMFLKISSGDFILFTPGLTPGYTSRMVYIVNKNLSFSYSLNRNCIANGINNRVMFEIIGLINQHSLT